MSYTINLINLGTKSIVIDLDNIDLMYIDDSCLTFVTKDNNEFAIPFTADQREEAMTQLQNLYVKMQKHRQSMLDALQNIG